MSTDRMQDIRNQVMWNRLISVVEEQAQTLVRTAFSTSTREAGDVSAGVFDGQGRMLAQAVTGTPGHVNSMARSVVHFLDVFPTQTMRDGDAYITNDPWKATGHLHDLLVREDPAMLSALRRARTMVMVGSGDRLTPPMHSRRIADLLPEAVLTVVAGAGHLLALERPDVVNRALRGFLMDCRDQSER